MKDKIERELNELYKRMFGAKPVALAFTPYEIEHLLNLIQLGMNARKREIYYARRRRDGVRPLNRWERHLLRMDGKIARKIMEAYKASFGEKSAGSPA